MNLPLLACLASGAGWTGWLAWRAPGGRLLSAAGGLLGGVSAFAIAWSCYALLERAGVPISWDAVLAGGVGAAATAAAIGLVEEGGKLAGVILASRVRGAGGRGAALRNVVAVSAVFAALESAALVGELGPGALLLRALLGPVAHAALSAPLALAVAGGSSPARRWAPALLLAAALHGACDLSLAAPAFGRLGYAVVLAAPVLLLYLQARLGAGREKGDGAAAA